ncbi:MAG: hypothetical protein Q9218_003305 [Villophora microphyllina]
MSGELTHPPPEATTYLNSVSKDLPNSHQHSSAADNIDLSASAASPGQSTFLNSASTTAQASPTEGIAGDPATSETFYTGTANEKSTEFQGSSPDASAPVPSTSAADFQPTAVGATISEGQGKSSKRNSKGSIKIPSRKTSAASNKLAKKDRTAAPAALSEEKNVEEELPENTAPPKKKGLSRFFSILNCCGASKDANTPELDPAVPPKKAKTLQPNRGRQATPMTKPDATSESSNTESKEAIVDSIAGPPYSELTPAAQPKIIEPKPKPATDKLALPSDHLPMTETKPATEQPITSDQPLPPIPPTALPTEKDDKDIAMTNSHEVYDEKSAPTSIDGPVETSAEPPATTTADAGNSTGDMVINDRTQQQEARDVEMPDAPPPPSASEQQTTSMESKVQVPPQSNLPPPPPTNPPIRPAAADRRTSNGVVASDTPKWLLPPMDARFQGKKCLVLDLDETLVHSSFKILHQADFTIPVEIEGQYHNVYVIKRPGVDQFMKRVGELYEVVVFTASVSKYGDPLLDQLDIHNVVHHRLFRESCYNHQGNYVKDLSQVGRDLRETIIIDNSPTSYIFHPQHAVPISSWFSDAHDNELLDLIPVLEDLAGPQVRDVSLVLDVGL